MAQTSFPTEMLEGHPGLVADAGPNDIVSRINGEATALPFGVAVIQNTAELAECLEPDGAISGAEILGFTVRSDEREHDSAGGASAYDGAVDPDTEVGVIKAGRLYVETEEAMALGDTVFVRVAAGGGGSVLGAIRNDADTASCIALTGARVVKPDLGQTVPMCVIELSGPLSLA